MHETNRSPDQVITLDELVQQGLCRTIMKAAYRNDKPRVHVEVWPAGAFVDKVYWMALFKVFTPSDKNRTVFVHELLTKPSALLGVKQVKEEGRDLVYVHLRHGRLRLELWFDPAVNYLVRKAIIHDDKDNTRGEDQVVHFKEAAPGIYFPEEVRTRSVRKGKDDGAAVHRFSDVRVNQPLPAGIFDLRYPAGSKVTDYVQNKVFEVQADGRLKHLADHRIVTGPLGPPVTFNAAVTREEPKSLLRWLLPLGLLLLTLAGVVVAWRRWKTRSAPGY